MKVKISKEDLLQGIQIVQNVVSPKATLPILSNMLVETKKDTLRLYTTDLDIGISCEIPVSIMEDGAITIRQKGLVILLGNFRQGMWSFMRARIIRSILKDKIAA